jgi:hypothetical protein
MSFLAPAYASLFISAKGVGRMSHQFDESRDGDSRLDWVEPEVRRLEISETSVNPGAGGDGGSADCTLS